MPPRVLENPAGATRVEITQSLPRKYREQLTNQGKCPNFMNLIKSNFSQSSTLELQFHEKIIHNTDPCYPPND